MASYILFLFLFGFLLAADIKCPYYVCNTTLGQDICSQMKTSEPSVGFELNSCASEKICDLKLTEEPDTCSKSYSQPLRFPGEFCRASSECFSNECDVSTKVCKGKSQNASCESDDQCNVKLYCNLTSKACEPLAKQDETCTTGKCGVGLVCENERCLQMGILKKGDKATLPSACETFYIVDGLCAEGPKLQVKKDMVGGQEPIDCQGQCVYKVGNDTTITESCQCGMVSNASSTFCSPGRGDIDLKDVLNNLN